MALGIDRGVGNCGYGVVVGRGDRLLGVDGGVIGTAAARPQERRLATVHERIAADVLDEHGPEAVALEVLSFGQDVGTAVRGGAGARRGGGGRRAAGRGVRR